MNKKYLSVFLAIILTTQTYISAFSQESIELNNIEASVAKDLLPKDLNEKVTIFRELNSLIIEGTPAEKTRLKNYISSIDRPLKHVEIEIKLIEFKKSNLRNIRFFRDTLGVNSVSGINSFLDLVPAPLLTPFGSSFGSVTSFPGIFGPVDGGILVGSISKGLSVFDFSPENWNVFNKNLSFLETKGVAQIHAYPKIVTIAGRPASININDHKNVVLGSSVRLSEFGVGNIQKLDSIKAGSNLQIIPTVSNENLITNNIQIDFSENSIQRTAQGSIIVPTSTFRREISTDIQVKSGQTVAIGGLVLNNNNLDKRGIPFITSIPFLGDIFSNRRTEKNKTELIVLITPKILELNNVNIKNTPNYSEIDHRFTKDEKLN